MNDRLEKVFTALAALAALLLVFDAGQSAAQHHYVSVVFNLVLGAFWIAVASLYFVRLHKNRWDKIEADIESMSEIAMSLNKTVEIAVEQDESKAQKVPVRRNRAQMSPQERARRDKVNAARRAKRAAARNKKG